jgi:TP901 family phage tail tape measure protein
MAVNTSTLKIIIRALDEFSGEFDKLKKQVDYIQKGMDKVESGAKKANTELAKLNQTAMAFSEIGTRLLAVGSALTAAVFFPTKAAADFERALDQVVAVTDDAVVQFDALTRTASELGRTTRYTALEAAQGMKFLGMAGFDAAETMKAIGPALSLAAVGQMSLAQAADISTNIMTAMSIPVENLTHVIDVLAKTSTSSNTSIIQMSEALKYTAPLAQAAGVTLEQVAASIGVLGNNGIQASLAGTSLRGMLLALSAPTKKAQDTLDRLGVQIGRNEDGTIDFIETLKRLRDANFDLADSNALFLRRSAAGALALSKQVDEVENLTNANIDAIGASQEMYDLMEGNLVGAVILLGSAFNGLIRSIGKPLLAPLEAVVRGLAKLASSIAEVIEEYPKLTSFMAGMVGVLGLSAIAFAGLAFSISGFLKVIHGFKTLFLVEKFVAITKATVAWTAAQKGLRISTIATNIVMATFGRTLAWVRKALVALQLAIASNPIGAALIVLGTVLAAVVAKFLLLRKSTGQLIDEQKKLVAEVESARQEFDRYADAMERYADDMEKAGDVALKLRKHLIKVAEDNEALAASALAAANSINLMTGEIKDGGKAIEEFEKITDRLKVDALYEQFRLTGEKIEEALGMGFWNSLYKNVSEGTAKIKSAFIKMGQDPDYKGWRPYKAFFEQDPSIPIEEVGLKYKTMLKVAQEDAKIAAAYIIVELEKMGKLDFSATEDQLRLLLERMGVESERQVDLFLAEYDRIVDGNTRKNKAVLDDNRFYNDASVVALRDSVNEQLRELDRIRLSRAQALQSGDVGMAAGLKEDEKQAQKTLKALDELYETNVQRAWSEGLKEQLQELRALEEQAESFKKVAADIAAASLADKDDLKLKAQALELMDRQYLLTNQIGDKQREIAEDTRKYSKNAERLIQESNEIEIAGITRAAYLKEKTEHETILATKQNSINLAKLRMDAARSDLLIISKNYDKRSALAAEYTKKVTKYEAQYEKDLESLADYRLKYDNENRQKKAKAELAFRKQAISAEKDSLKKFEKLRKLEREKLQKTSEEWMLKDKELMAKAESLIDEKYAKKRAEFLKKQDERRKRFLREQLRAELELSKQATSNELNELTYRFNQGQISLEEYYEERRRIIAKNIAEEIQFLKDKLAMASEEEQPAIEIQIKIKRREEVIATGGVDREETTATIQREKDIQNRLISIKQRALRSWEFGERQDLEKQASEQRMASELAAFKKLNLEKANFETKLDEFKSSQADQRAKFDEDQAHAKFNRDKSIEQDLADVQMSAIAPADFESREQLETENFIRNQQVQWEAFQKTTQDKDDLDEYFHNMMTARSQRFAEEEQAILQGRLSLAAKGFGDLSDVFGGIYEASGKKLKTFAKLQKAMAIAQTVIETYKAAQAAFSSQALIPYVGPALAAAAAAAAIASGMARVHAISSQEIAEGGPVFDRKGEKKKGKEVPVKLTAKEWKFPKEKVNKYGRGLFEAIRTRSLPVVVADILLNKESRQGSTGVQTGYGEVSGYSPHSKADNIQTTAIPGDFIMPVDAARFYGRNLMRALEKGAIPSDWLKLFHRRRYATGGEVVGSNDVSRVAPPKANIPILSQIDKGLESLGNLRKISLPKVELPTIPKYAYAVGGPVTGQPQQDFSTTPVPSAYQTAQKKLEASQEQKQEEIVIYNVQDPRDMDKWASSATGQRAILNVISSRAGTVRRIIR